VVARGARHGREAQVRNRQEVARMQMPRAVVAVADAV
jgi:hypothetical protein